MNSLFISVLNMSITASILVLAVILLRFALRRAPRWIVCVLWSFVALRLIFPFSVESMFSLMPESDPISSESIAPENQNSEGLTQIEPDGLIYIDPNGSAETVPIAGTSEPSVSFENDSYIQLEYGPSLADIFGAVWLIGIFAMLIYTTASYLRLRRRVAESIIIKGNIYICDRIDTPFILGILRPRIYLPSSMSEADAEHVISHERAHLRRLDHIWKPLGFLLLSIHWFNPLLWLGYILLCRDIEIACDEKVIREQGAEIKKPYSEALVNCSVPRKMIAACPLAFGEVAVKNRVKGVLNYKKPTFWIIILAVIALIVTAVCFLTDPVKEEENTAVYTVSYYDAPTRENLSPVISKTARISSEHFEPMFKELENSEWTNDAAVDRLPYYFDGQIDTGEHIIFFAFEQKVLYCEGYFTGLSDENSEFLQTIIEDCGISEETSLSNTELSTPSAEKRYNIYVCQFARGSYQFIVTPENEELTWQELWGTQSIRMEELRRILADYGATANDVNIIPWQNPLSSYIGEYWIMRSDNEADQKKLRARHIAIIKDQIFGEGELFKRTTIKDFDTEESTEGLDEFLAVLKATEVSDNPNFLSNWTNCAPAELRQLGFGYFYQSHSGISRIFYDGKIYEGLGYLMHERQFAIADGNYDCVPEFYFTYAWGSEIIRMGFACFDPVSCEVIRLGEEHIDSLTHWQASGDTLMAIARPTGWTPGKQQTVSIVNLSDGKITLMELKSAE